MRARPLQLVMKEDSQLQGMILVLFVKASKNKVNHDYRPRLSRDQEKIEQSGQNLIILQSEGAAAAKDMHRKAAVLYTRSIGECSTKLRRICYYQRAYRNHSG